MTDRFARFPADLARRARTAHLGHSGIPALLAHPDWESPAPTVVWLHGRTVTKELDPGRYLRWVRAGIAACALDLPGHGERLDLDFHSPKRTLDLLDQAIPEIDEAVEALASPAWNGVFDTTRLALGGMSAGGMATLRRLCDPHPFTCAAVESAAGSLACLYNPQRPAEPGLPGSVPHPPDRVARLDPLQHIATWRPIPLLVLHSEADRAVPITCIRPFVEALRAHYAAHGASPSLIEFTTWPETGAPDEHAGFGRVAAEAKTKQTDFLTRALKTPVP